MSLLFVLRRLPTHYIMSEAEAEAANHTPL